jgi:hypothetical protein
VLTGIGLTVITFVAEQPVGLENVSVNVPVETGVTVVLFTVGPGAVPVTVAMVVGVDSQLPLVASVSTIVDPIHTEFGPLIAAIPDVIFTVA